MTGQLALFGQLTIDDALAAGPSPAASPRAGWAHNPPGPRLLEAMTGRKPEQPNGLEPVWPVTAEGLEALGYQCVQASCLAHRRRVWTGGTSREWRHCDNWACRP